MVTFNLAGLGRVCNDVDGRESTDDPRNLQDGRTILGKLVTFDPNALHFDIMQKYSFLIKGSNTKDTIP